MAETVDLNEDVYIQAPYDAETVAVVKRESLEVWESLGWKVASKAKAENAPVSNIPDTTPPEKTK